MVRTTFDVLPNELIFRILDYLTNVDAWFAFYDLNIRWNNLLQSHQMNFDLSQCRRSQLDFIYQNVLSKIEKPFAIRFRPKMMAESTYRLFHELESNNVEHKLQSLTLTHMTEQAMGGVVQYLDRLVNLRSLTIMHEREKLYGKFIDRIMNLNMPSVTYLKLGDIGRYSGLHVYEGNFNDLRSVLPNIQKLVLRISISFNTFRRVLLMSPQVRSIEVLLMERSVDEITDKSYNRDFAPALQKLVITMNGIIRFKVFSKLLRALPQLRTFWLSTLICDNSHGTEYQDGQIWKDLIRKSLPNLIDFRLNVGLEATNFTSPSDVIQSFRSPFWTQEKKWSFIADRPENDVDTIELYSLPPPTHGKIIFRPNVQWDSNSSNPSFKSVRTLGLLPTLDPSMSRAAQNRCYTNVTTIRPVSVSGHNRTYDVSIISDYVDLTKVENCTIDVSELMEALSAMTKLTSLTLRCYDGDVRYLNNISSPIFTLKKLFLSESMHCYYYNRNDLKIITRLFPNLEHVELRISEFESLPILLNRLHHLVYAIIYNEPEAIDEHHLKHWLHKNEGTMKFTWSLEDKRLDIWLD